MVLTGTSPSTALGTTLPGDDRAVEPAREQPGADRTGSRLVGSRTIAPRQVATWIVAVVVVALLATAAVIYGLGPLTQQRTQRSLMSSYRLAITHAAAETNGLGGISVSTQPPITGSTVGILQIGVLGIQQAVVEGVGPAQTDSGPGHVPGTAGIGQPGNAAVVARRSGFGGPFAHLDQLQHGDRILVATTQGQSLYIVRQVKTETLVNGSPTTSSTLTGVSTGPKPTGTVSTTKLYGPTPGDQLTLVTSASSAPWNTDRAIVVTATMRGKPFAPTPQQSRSPSQDGNSGDPNALPVLALAVLALVATLIGAVALYRRASLRSAYLLTTAPLIVFTVLGAEAASRLLPAWM